jgi:hypothetical protein
MNTALFTRFEPCIRDFNPADPKAFDCLLLERREAISIYYAPFDYVNASAKLVLVGITPGKKQMIKSLVEAKYQLQRGASPELICHAAKQSASFQGMRGSLVKMLDYFEINKWLGIESCNRLFSDKNGLVQTTSMLRYPVFVGDSNYNGTPSVLGNRLLQRYVLEYFGSEAKQLTSALFVPLGPKVSKVLEWLGSEGAIKSERVLNGFPHASGANNERISYILGKKSASALSAKTNPRKLDGARAMIRAKVASLRSS